MPTAIRGPRKWTIDKMASTKFGRLSPIMPMYRKGAVVYWLCLCDCGVTKIISQNKLTSGWTESCGCLHSMVCSAASKTHGMSDCPEFYVWVTMKQRCANPNNKSYADYGGRGIKVCERWLESFDNFYADMGSRPSDGHTIERMDNNGHYEPGNCRWATRSEQAKNKRPIVRKSHCGLGHQFTQENTKIRKNGSRDCRACWKVRNARRYH